MTKHGRKKWGWLLVSGIALAAATTAAASNFGPIENQIYFANGSHHKFTWEGLSDGFRGASNWVRENEVAPTDMTTEVISNHSNADVAVYDAEFGDTGWCGIADCIVEKNNRVCKHWHVKYNQSNGIGCPNDYTTTERRSLACEEIGHTLGLHHRFTTNGCMSQQWDKTHLTRHDKRHINRRY